MVSWTILPEIGSVGLEHGRLLVSAWVFLTIPILSVGLSFFSAAKAASRAIDALDEKESQSAFDSSWNKLIPWLNAIGGISFAIGLILMLCFAIANYSSAVNLE